MPRKKRTNTDIRAEKDALYSDLERGALTLGQATRRMRKIIGVTQAEYATRILKIFPRVLMDLENDRGNPTLDTLQKVAKPFGLKVSFVRQKPENRTAPPQLFNLTEQRRCTEFKMCCNSLPVLSGIDLALPKS